MNYTRRSFLSSLQLTRGRTVLESSCFETGLEHIRLQRSNLHYKTNGEYISTKVSRPVPQRVGVIGAGPAGVATAVGLQLEGHQVTLFDDISASELSQRGGCTPIADYAVEPLALPEFSSSSPWSLLLPGGGGGGRAPLGVGWRHMMSSTGRPWVQALRACAHPTQVDRISLARSALLQHAWPAWEAILQGAGVDYQREQRGHLTVFQSESGFAKYSAELAVQQSRLVPHTVISKEEALQLEPCLARCGVPIHKAVLHPTGGLLRLSGSDDVKTGNSEASVSKALLHFFEENRGRVVEERVKQITPGAMIGWDSSKAGDWRRPLETSQHVPHSPQQSKMASETVHTHNDREFVFNFVVICAGACSASLLEKMGAKLPLGSLSALSVCTHDVEPTRPIIFPESRAYASPAASGGGARISTMMDLATDACCNESGIPPSPDQAELARHLEEAADLFGLSSQRSQLTVQNTTGAVLPDSLPALGRALYARPNVLCNFGHGPFGITLAGASAALITDIVARRSPRVELSDYEVCSRTWDGQ